MKKLMLAVVAAVSLSTALAFAAQPSTYQVTGQVLAVGDDTITVQKGTEKWEIAKAADTKMEGGDAVKVGDKVTITYRMTASKIELKPAKSAKTAKTK